MLLHIHLSPPSESWLTARPITGLLALRLYHPASDHDQVNFIGSVKALQSVFVTATFVELGFSSPGELWSVNRHRHCLTPSHGSYPRNTRNRGIRGYKEWPGC